MTTTVRPGSVAGLRRESWQTDARILAARGLSHAQIAAQLHQSRATITRWLS